MNIDRSRVSSVFLLCFFSSSTSRVGGRAPDVSRGSRTEDGANLCESPNYVAPVAEETQPKERRSKNPRSLSKVSPMSFRHPLDFRVVVCTRLDARPKAPKAARAMSQTRT